MSERNYWQRMRRVSKSRRVQDRSSGRSAVSDARIAPVGCRDLEEQPLASRREIPKTVLALFLVAAGVLATAVIMSDGFADDARSAEGALVQQPPKDVPRGQPLNNGAVGGKTLQQLMINAERPELASLISYNNQQQELRPIVHTGFSESRSSGHRVRVGRSALDTSGTNGPIAVPPGLGWDRDSWTDLLHGWPQIVRRSTLGMRHRYDETWIDTDHPEYPA